MFILVIPRYVDKSYLQSGDGSSQISATIYAPNNDLSYLAAFALVNGQLHIFGGLSDHYKVLICLTSQNYEIKKKTLKNQLRV